MSLFTAISDGLSALTLNPGPRMALSQRRQEQADHAFQMEQARRAQEIRELFARQDQEIREQQARMLRLSSALESLRNESETCLQ